MHIRHARLQRIVTVRSVAARLVSHAASQHEQQVFDARLAVLHREQGRVRHEAAGRDASRNGSAHLEFLHLLLELTDGEVPNFIYETLHPQDRAFTRGRRGWGQRRESLVGRRDGPAPRAPPREELAQRAARAHRLDFGRVVRLDEVGQRRRPLPR